MTQIYYSTYMMTIFSGLMYNNYKHYFPSSCRDDSGSLYQVTWTGCRGLEWISLSDKGMFTPREPDNLRRTDERY